MANSAKMTTVAVTAIVTAYNRIDQTLLTLQKLYRCEPGPGEIIVHVDANQMECEAAIRNAFPEVKIIRSENCVGPGGGRNKLIAAASNDIIASFDDDSYPIDTDYFARILSLFEKFPTASILNATVYHQGEEIKAARQEADWVSDFAGGACAYQRKVLQITGGYVPLPIAYGMEEVDLAYRFETTCKS
jgi:GT2 family glycosyltransferase